MKKYPIFNPPLSSLFYICRKSLQMFYRHLKEITPRFE